MANIFGVSNHSPEVLIKQLLKCKIAKSSASIGIVQVNSKLSPKRAHDFLLFLTPADLHRNVLTLNTEPYRTCKAFLFANPMRVAELANVRPLDFEPNIEYPGFGFNLRNLNLAPVKMKAELPPIKRVNGKYLSKLISYVRQGSLLNPLMTFLYTLPSSSQTHVKVAIAKWLYAGKSDSSLKRGLGSIKQVSVTARITEKLEEILLTDIGGAFRAAFAEYRAEQAKGVTPINVLRIAKTHGVSAYEMRYILSVVADSKRAQNYSDSFDKVKNGKKAA